MPVTGVYIQCKICSGELPEDGMGWEWVPESDARPKRPRCAAVPLRPPRPMPDFGGLYIPWRAVELVEAAVRFEREELVVMPAASAIDSQEQGATPSTPSASAIDSKPPGFITSWSA